jgi:hypothetical protein
MARKKGNDDLLGVLRAAGEAVRSRLPGSGASKRSQAGKKAALTRKRNALKRSQAAKKGAATRAMRRGRAKPR